MELENHRLRGSDVAWNESPNHGGKFAEGLPDTIVIHYTAGASADSSVRTLCDPHSRASAHLVVGRDGTVHQLVPFDTVTWHAGKSSWRGRSGYNRYAIGIEIDNAGHLTPNGSGGYLSWFNRLYPAEEVIEAVHRNEQSPRFWHRYSEAQIARVFELCALLCGSYPIGEILGHEEIAPRRKLDPGPAFPLDRLREKLLYEDRSAEGAEEERPETLLARVGVGRLNIRSGPGTGFATVAEPLAGGSEVEILERQGEWVRVRYATEGWVSAHYLR
jgi:N-acetylmuramoyl-L-alanine amidase